MTTYDALLEGSEINLAIVKLANDTEDLELANLLVCGDCIFDAEGEDLLRVLDQIQEAEPAYAARIEQIRDAIIPRMQLALSGVQAV